MRVRRCGGEKRIAVNSIDNLHFIDTYFAKKYAESRYAPELLSLKMIDLSMGNAM